MALMPVASQTETPRFFGRMKLRITPDSVDLSRVTSAGRVPMLADHDDTKIIGTVADASVIDNLLYIEPRWSDSELATRIVADIESGIRKGVSIRFRPTKMTLLERGDEDTEPLFEVTNWALLEVSSVAIPALPDVHLSIEGVDTPVSLGVKSESEEKLNAMAAELLSASQPEPEIEAERSEADEVNEMPEAQDTALALAAVKDEILADAKERGEDYASEAVKYLSGEDVSLTGWLKKALSINVQPKRMRDYAADNRANRGDRLSIAHALAHLGAPKNPAFEKLAAAEVEAMKETDIPQHILAMGGDWAYLPDAFWADERLSSTAASAAGPAVETRQLPGVVQRFHDASPILQQCSIRTGLTDLIEVVQFGATSQNWDEEAEGGSQNTGTFNLTEVNLRPKILRTGFEVTNLLQLMAPQAEVSARSDVVRAMTAVLNSRILFGTGGTGSGDQGQGLHHTYITGLKTVTNRSGFDYGDVVDMETDIFERNVPVGNLTFVVDSRTYAVMKKVTRNGDGGDFIVVGGRAAEMPVIRTNAFAPSSNTRAADQLARAGVMGDFSYQMVGFWGGMAVLVDPYTEADKQKVLIRFSQYYDCHPTRIEPFQKLTFTGA